MGVVNMLSRTKTLICKLIPYDVAKDIKFFFQNYAVITRELFQFRAIRKSQKQRIFYLGKTWHSNLGDLAQHYCIKQWIAENYPNSDAFEFEDHTVIYKYTKFTYKLKQTIRPNDIIVFQSGYTTQDLGGYHELMHRMVIQAVPDANILMFPQTVFFKEEVNRKRTSQIYNTAKNMLFLARDKVSYEMSKEMFPDIKVLLFPDIVTSLIGTYPYNSDRHGVLFCCRDDTEKFYDDNEIDELINRIKKMTMVEKTDTTISEDIYEIRANLKGFIDREIKKYSRYKAIVTDRYHGTIFSLIANTPVIVIKTNDHKVVTGVDWFKGVYDSHVFLADSLDNAYELVKSTLNNYPCNRLEPYFKPNYYDNLKDIFENKE